jgi:hypothetical protein
VIVYLCGPISLGGTCTPEQEAEFTAAFMRHAIRLRQHGVGVVSPVEFEPCESWESYMRLGLTAVCHVDQVAVLPRWLESRGAVLEVYVARQLGIPVMEVERVAPLVSRALPREAAPEPQAAS